MMPMHKAVFVEPLSHLFYWRKICTHLDIPNCSLSGTVNLNYDDGHDPKPIQAEDHFFVLYFDFNKKS